MHGLYFWDENFEFCGYGFNTLRFEGEYLNGKRNGKGK